MFAAAVKRVALPRTRTAVRSMATATQNVKAPLTLFGIDGRYATALYTAAAKSNALETVENDLSSIKRVLAADQKLHDFLQSPGLDQKAKKIGVDAILSKGKFSHSTANFLKLLAENGRLNQTTKVISAYENLMTAHRGEIAVTVTSAKPLDSSILTRLTKSLQKSDLVGVDKKPIVTNKVDPQILSGLIIEVGERTIDLSVSSKINKLNRLLTETI